MSATFAHPSALRSTLRPPGGAERSVGGQHAATRSFSRPVLRRRGRHLGVCEAWRLLSDDPPSFGDDD